MKITRSRTGLMAGMVLFGLMIGLCGCGGGDDGPSTVTLVGVSPTPLETPIPTATPVPFPTPTLTPFPDNPPLP